MRHRTLFDEGLFLVSFSVALGVLALIIPARGATLDDFQARTTSQYVDLCEAGSDQPNYIAAVQFCQGFASGAYQYYVANAARDPNARFVCFTDYLPTRDAIIAAFIAWVKAHPESKDAPPVDSIFRYLMEAYPCGSKRQASR
jgi:hypothetical protein